MAAERLANASREHPSLYRIERIAAIVEMPAFSFSGGELSIRPPVGAGEPPVDERARLFRICDRALRAGIEHLEPRFVVGLGNFAAERAREALAGLPVVVGRVLHPSPQSPAANRGWARAATRDLARLGIRLPV